MAVTPKQQRTCKNGHTYFKSSDCPTCPVCEQERKPELGFMSTLSAPAGRALRNAGIQTLEDLTTFTETELLALHGMGPSSIPKLKAMLAAENRSLKS